MVQNMLYTSFQLDHMLYGLSLGIEQKSRAARNNYLSLFQLEFYKKNYTLAQEGQKSEFAYIVLRGEVKIYKKLIKYPTRHTKSR